MADRFRSIQKSECHDGAPNGGSRPYGCPCCRGIANLVTFKKWARKISRRRLKHHDRTKLEM
jgi:hypothetical protein